jgi:hypothetical protein
MAKLWALAQPPKTYNLEMRNEARREEYIVVVTSSRGHPPVWSWEI